MRSKSNRMRALGALGLVAFFSSFYLAAVVPTDVQGPGTQPADGVTLESPNKCDNCHAGYDPAVEPYFTWNGSMMAHATRDPLFWATVAVAEQDFDGVGDLCLRCHTPEGWLAGRSTPTDGSGLQANDASGVSCDLCHQFVRPDESENPGVQFDSFLAYDDGSPPEGFYGSGMYVLSPDGNSKIGPYADGDADAPHQVLVSSFHRSSDLCGTCHDVSNPVVGDLAHNHGAMVPLEPGTFSGVPGAPLDTKAAFQNPPYAYGSVERTYSEHVASELPTTLVGDYATLPPELQAGSIEVAHDAALASTFDGNYVDGTLRFFTCQTCHMPPVTGKGCNKQSAPLRTDLPLHDLVGGNYWMPDVLLYLDSLGELTIGGGLDATDAQALAAGKTRALQNLANAASLEIDGTRVRVVDLTGHKLLTGFPEGRRMWLRVTWLDAAGAVMRVDGEYGALNVVHDGVPLVVETLLDPDGSLTKVWEAEPGMSSEWAAQLLQLGYSPDLPLDYGRTDGVTTTLGDLASMPPGKAIKTFHFALNNVIVSDDRIPPYGMRYDAALERSCLPVPASLFGNPGPGGTYRHWDDVYLMPPPKACTATVELLYQPTSWEYVQFLDLANDEQNAFLGDTGEKMLDAWLATGMASPATMAAAQWFRDCNANGVADCDDIQSGVSSDANGNTIPDECEPTGPQKFPIGSSAGSLTLAFGPLGAESDDEVVVVGAEPGRTVVLFVLGRGPKPAAVGGRDVRLLGLGSADANGIVSVRLPAADEVSSSGDWIVARDALGRIGFLDGTRPTP